MSDECHAMLEDLKSRSGRIQNSERVDKVMEGEVHLPRRVQFYTNIKRDKE